MKASRLPRPVTSGCARLLPVFTSSELAGKRLRHLSGSSSSSDAASSQTPAKTKRALAPSPASSPLTGCAAAATPSPTDIGYASADVTVQFPAPVPQRPHRKRDKPRDGAETIDVEGACAFPSSPLPSTSDDGFTLVKKKKGKKTPPASVLASTAAATDGQPAPPDAAPPGRAAHTAPPGPAARSAPPSRAAHPSPAAPRASRPAVGVARQQPLQCKYPAFRVPVQEGFHTSYDAVAALEDANPHLQMKNVIGKDGSSVLLPLDEATFATLEAAASTPDGPVTLLKLQPNTQLTKGVVMGYSLRMPLSLLQRHPHVEEATRCVSSRTKQETQQVIVAIRGSLPEQIDLGNWGVYYTRPYTPEPLRCYNCQRFGHHRATCSRPPVCGICSSGHLTQQCLDKFKAKEEITNRCPNCSKGHHAWNLGCPARLQRVRAGRLRQVQWVREQQRTTLRPAPPGTFIWGGQQTTAPSTAATEEEFPPLTPAPSLPQPQPTPPPAPLATSPSGGVVMSPDVLRAFARQVTLTVSEIVLHSAGITDITAIQETLLRKADTIVDEIVSANLK